MTRNELSPTAELMLFIPLMALLAPTTIIYAPASVYLFMALREAPGLIFFIPLSGYGIYCSWCIALKINEYIQFGVPLHIYCGVAAGTLALHIITKTFGIFNNISEILNNITSAIIFGYGPLIASYTSLLLIYVMRRKFIHH